MRGTSRSISAALRVQSEDARRVEGARAGWDLAAEHRPGSLRDRLLHLAVELVAQLAARLRSDLRRRIGRVADADGLHGRGEPLEEGVVHLRLDDEALRADAALARVHEDRPRRRPDRSG